MVAVAKQEKSLREYTREVRCKLDERQRESYGARLANLVEERRLVDDKKKQVAKEYATKISDIDNEIARTADALSKGEELRACNVYDIWNNGIVETRRRDNDEVVDTRPASLADRQVEFPGLSEDEDEEEPELDETPSAEVAAEGAEGELVESSVGDQVYVGDPNDHAEIYPASTGARCSYVEDGRQCVFAEGHGGGHRGSELDEGVLPASDEEKVEVGDEVDVVQDGLRGKVHRIEEHHVDGGKSVTMYQVETRDGTGWFERCELAIAPSLETNPDNLTGDDPPAAAPTAKEIKAKKARKAKAAELNGDGDDDRNGNKPETVAHPEGVEVTASAELGGSKKKPRTKKPK